MTRGLQAQRKLQATLAHRERGQLDRRIGISENSGDRGVPGQNRGNDAEPAAELDYAGRSSQKSNRQEQECQEQHEENGHQGAVQLQRSKEHEAGENGPTEQVVAHPGGVTYSEALPEDETSSQPEASIGAEGGCGKGVVSSELLDACNELDKPTVEECQANED